MNWLESRAPLAAALVLLLLASPAALAHGAPASYDPLVVELHAYLTSRMRVTETPPAAGVVPFVAAGAPGSPPPSLGFNFQAPVRFVAGSGFLVELVLRADAPVVTRDASGMSLELAIEPGGPPHRIALPDPVLAPGSVATVTARLEAGALEYAEGVELALRVTPLMPFTDGALSLVVGGELPSRLDVLDMRVPTPKDLGLQDLPLTTFLLANESFEPPSTHAVNVFRVGHSRVDIVNAPGWSPNGTYVVLRGEEEDAHAHAFPDAARRIEAAHEFQVNGLLVRAHPGLGVVVRVTAPPIEIDCARNCPPGGFTHTFAATAPTAGGETPSVLVPPPRDTSGIPVSKDEPAAKDTPLVGIGAALALALAGLAGRRGPKR